MRRKIIAVLGLFFCTVLSAHAESGDGFHWRVPPTSKLMFDPAVGLDMRSPALSLHPSPGGDGQPGIGFGLMLLSADECRLRLLGVGYTVDGHGGYLTLTPFSIRISGEPGMGWNFAPVYLRRTRESPDQPRWQGIGFQFSLRFSLRTDSDIPRGSH